MLNLLRSRHIVFHGACPIHIPANSVGGSRTPHILAGTYVSHFSESKEVFASSL